MARPGSFAQGGAFLCDLGVTVCQSGHLFLSWRQTASNWEAATRQVKGVWAMPGRAAASVYPTPIYSILPPLTLIK